MFKLQYCEDFLGMASRHMFLSSGPGTRCQLIIVIIISLSSGQVKSVTDYGNTFYLVHCFEKKNLKP